MNLHLPAEGPKKRAVFALCAAAGALLACTASAKAAPPAKSAVPAAPARAPLVVRVDASAPPRPARPPAFEGAAVAVGADGEPLPEPQPAPAPEPDPAQELLAAMRAAWPPHAESAPVVELPAALSKAVTAEAQEVAPGVTVAALRMPGVVVVAVRRAAPPAAVVGDGGVGEASPAAPPAPPVLVPVRFDVRLPRGLWRGDAAQLAGAEAATPSRWRLQSILCPATATVAKTLPVAPGQTLVLRFTETVAEARRAHAACREFTQEGGATYSGASIRTAYREIGSILDSLPAFVARGDRAAVTKKVHRALLSAAQAQAMLENARGSGLFEAERGMLTLVGALSEISCAASGLVPSQSVVKVGEDGAPAAVRVTLTNAGAKTVPVVALGFSASDAAADTGAPFPDVQNVFRDVRPGRRVSAFFPVSPSSAGRGMVRFIIGMGAAAVPATPTP